MTGVNTKTNEALHSISGTVISPSGLTVLSLSATDPAVTGLLSAGLETPQDLHNAPRGVAVPKRVWGAAHLGVCLWVVQ